MSACANWARLRCRQTAADKAVHTQAGEHRRTMPCTPSQQATTCAHTQQTVPHPPLDSVPQAVKGPHRIHAPADNAPCAHTGQPRCAHTGDMKMQVAPYHSHKGPPSHTHTSRRGHVACSHLRLFTYMHMHRRMPPCWLHQALHTCTHTNDAGSGMLCASVPVEPEFVYQVDFDVVKLRVYENTFCVTV